MSSSNEQRTRAGYNLFLAADVTNDTHWSTESPLAGVMADDIMWFDDEGAAAQVALVGKVKVLERLRELRAAMVACQILSCQEIGRFVHTLDHAVKVGAQDQALHSGARTELCSSSFSFNDEGKVTVVHYCTYQQPLTPP